MTYISLNGQLVSEQQALVSVQDRGFRFGDGVFETIAIYDGVPYQFEYHLKRLVDGLTAIKIKFDSSSLKANAHALLKENSLQTGMLRLQVTRGIGSRGYLPVEANSPTCIIETVERPELPDGSIKLWLSNYQKPPALYLPTQFKLCQGLNSTLARMDAVENGCFDALMLGENGYVCETSSANIFWLKNGKLHTPALGFGTLTGSTRAALMRTASSPIEEVVASVSELAQASAVVITNCAWQVLPVGGLEPKGIKWQSDALALQLRVQLAKDINEYTRNHRADWQ